jgi:hypothetical protein
MSGRGGGRGMRSRPFALAIVITMLAGCAQRPTLPPATPPPAAAHIQPPDWFHQQIVAARAARRAHQPKADTAGAQRAYDDLMTAACTRAASAGPGRTSLLPLWRRLPREGLSGPCGRYAFRPGHSAASPLSLCRVWRERDWDRLATALPVDTGARPASGASLRRHDLPDGR